MVEVAKYKKIEEDKIVEEKLKNYQKSQTLDSKN